jgi:hypothetical protein
VRNWRQKQKLRKVIQVPPQSLRHSNQNDHFSKATSATSNSNVSPAFLYQPMQLRSIPVVNQRALKTSPDGALQTGRSAVQAYQISRGQLSAPRSSPKRKEIRRSSAVLPAQSIQHLAVPIASVLVEVISSFFS